MGEGLVARTLHGFSGSCFAARRRRDEEERRLIPLPNIQRSDRN